MALDFMIPLRIAQAVVGIIALGLAGYVAHWYNRFTNFDSPDQVNFLIFDGVWTPFLAVPYLALAPRFVPRITHKFAILGVEAVTMIFWFAGFIALAAFLGDLSFCSGTVCNSARAATAFGAIEWLLFAVTTTLAAIHVFKGGRSSSSGPISSEPQMSEHNGL